jgi:hypothetical protein
VRANYASVASQWREMAEQELKERRRLALLRRLGTLSIWPRTSGADVNEAVIALRLMLPISAGALCAALRHSHLNLHRPLLPEWGLGLAGRPSSAPSPGRTALEALTLSSKLQATPSARVIAWGSFCT